MHSITVKEKRQAVRHDCVAAIKWSYFSQFSAYDARILNFSSDGLYLETDQALKPGTTVWIRVDHRLAEGTGFDSASECLPTVAVADTKWCLELPETSVLRYGLGLRYQFPTV